MSKTLKIVVALVAAAVVAVTSGAAYAVGLSKANTSAATTSEPPAYGACVNTKTGAVRVLEKDNLAKSRYGSCKQDGSETFMLLSSGVTAMTKLPAQVAFSAGGKHYVCDEAAATPLRKKVGNRYAAATSPFRYRCTEAVTPREARQVQRAN